MTQAEKDKIIKELREKLAEAENIEVDKSKCWKPEHGEEYWCVSNGGEVCWLDWCNDVYCNWNYLTDNCFKTKEEAEEYKKQIEYTARYKNYIEEHSEPLDWHNYNQSKYYAEINCDFDVINVDSCCYLKSQGTIYASSEQIIRGAIKEIGEDNFKKYVLGVK